MQIRTGWLNRSSINADVFAAMTPAADGRIVRACVETLEARRMLSANAVLKPNGTLKLTGTDDDDVLNLTSSSGVLYAEFNGKTKSFTASGVRAILVQGLGGDDRVKIGTRVRGAQILGGDGNDTLNGGDGGDTIDGGAGADRIRGRSGFDFASYKRHEVAVDVKLDDQANDGAAGEGDDVRSDTEGVLGGTGADTITGSSGNNDLRGGGGKDTLLGADGNDTLRGDNGGDWLVGGGGRDVMFGGSSSDWVSYEDMEQQVLVSIDNDANDGQAGEGDNIRKDVENVLGGSGDDVMIGSSGNNRLKGGPGNDGIRGGKGDDVLSGGDGNDRLDGNGGADTLAGDDGTDTADYASRDNNLVIKVDDSAGDGVAGENDFLRDSVEVILGGSGNDSILGGDAPNQIKGAAGNDSLDGGDGDDTLEGGAGVDWIWSGPGADAFFGGADADTMLYEKEEADVTITLDGEDDDGAEGEGDNVGADFESVFGGMGDDLIVGNDVENMLRGGPGNDTIRGGDGSPDDRLFGEDGDDVLYGEEGVDRLDGQGGNDTFFTRDGIRDFISGGLGDDTAHVDDEDAPLSDIENILTE